jgi:hypothetical protein
MVDTLEEFVVKVEAMADVEDGMLVIAAVAVAVADAVAELDDVGAVVVVLTIAFEFDDALMIGLNNECVLQEGITAREGNELNTELDDIDDEVAADVEETCEIELLLLFVLLVLLFAFINSLTFL